MTNSNRVYFYHPHQTLQLIRVRYRAALIAMDWVYGYDARPRGMALPNAGVPSQQVKQSHDSTMLCHLNRSSCGVVPLSNQAIRSTHERATERHCSVSDIITPFCPHRLARWVEHHRFSQRACSVASSRSSNVLHRSKAVRLITGDGPSSERRRG